MVGWAERCIQLMCTTPLYVQRSFHDLGLLTHDNSSVYCSSSYVVVLCKVSLLLTTWRLACNVCLVVLSMWEHLRYVCTMFVVTGSMSNVETVFSE